MEVAAQADRQASMMPRPSAAGPRGSTGSGALPAVPPGQRDHFSAPGSPGIRPANEVGPATAVQEFHGQAALRGAEALKKQGFQTDPGGHGGGSGIRGCCRRPTWRGRAGRTVAVPLPAPSVGERGGWSKKAWQRLVVTDREIQGCQGRRRRAGVHGTAGASGRQAAHRQLPDLQVGDYVVPPPIGRPWRPPETILRPGTTGHPEAPLRSPPVDRSAAIGGGASRGSTGWAAASGPRQSR